MALIARLAAAAALLVLLTAPALAEEACDGSIQASVLQPLPSPLVVTVENLRNTPNAPKAEASFIDGLRSAGVKVEPDAENVLRLTFLITSTGTAELPHEYTDFSWTAVPGAASGPPPTITVTVGLGGRTRPNLSWVASLACQVNTTDPTMLAQQLGQVIGEVLSKQLSQESF